MSGCLPRFITTYQRVGRAEGFSESFRVASENEIEDMLAYLGRSARSAHSTVLPAVSATYAFAQSSGQQLPATVHSYGAAQYPAAASQAPAHSAPPANGYGKPAQVTHSTPPANGFGHPAHAASAYQPGASQWQPPGEGAHSMGFPSHHFNPNQAPGRQFDPSWQNSTGSGPSHAGSEPQSWHALPRPRLYPATSPYGSAASGAPRPYAPIAGQWQGQGGRQTASPSRAQQQQGTRRARWDSDRNGFPAAQGGQNGSGYQWDQARYSGTGGPDRDHWLHQETGGAGGTYRRTDGQQGGPARRAGGVSAFRETLVVSGRDSTHHAGQQTLTVTQQYRMKQQDWRTPATSAGNTAQSSGGTYAQQGWQNSAGHQPHASGYALGHPAAVRDTYARADEPRTAMGYGMQGALAQRNPKKQDKADKNSSSGGKRDAGRTDTRIILLFDLNGTLTSHTSKRGSSGVNKMRPGIHHLRRLQVRNPGLGVSRPSRKPVCVCAEETQCV
jgi:hypothetical protein